MRWFEKESVRGSVAFEYLLVSTFVAFAGMAILGVVAHMTQGRLETIASKLGIDIDDINLNFFE